jgi:hypothetical protein
MRFQDSSMKAFHFATLRTWIMIAGVSLVAAGALQAQAPPGPLPAGQPQQVPGAEAKPLPPPPPPRQTILGAWKLNRDESDSPRKRSEDDSDSNAGSGGRRSGGGWPGGGYPGGGHGGYGRPRGESDEERQKMHELLTPPNTMALSMTGAEVDLIDDRDRKRALMTDGRKLQKSKDANYQEIAAKWDGNRLVTDEKDPRGNKMSRTFELSEDGRQLYETLHMTSGRNNRSTVIRYVYDIPALKGEVLRPHG